MKIALIVPGGVDRSGTHRVIPCLLWLIERLTAGGDEVHVFALQQEPRPATWPLLGATIHNAGTRPRRLRALAQLLAEHRRGAFDIIHAFWAAGPGVTAALFGRLTGVRSVITLPGGDLAALPEIDYGARLTMRGRMMTRLVLRSCNRIVVPSQWIGEQAHALGVATTCIPYGVAIDHWPATTPRRRDPLQPLRLIHVASLNRVKDQDTLLRAMRLLHERGMAFHLDVIGMDTLDGAAQRHCLALGLQSRVDFHGFMPQAEIRPWIDRSDLMVISSRHEGVPIVVLEAAVAGVPSVGTRVGQIADWAPHAAVAVPIGDAAALALAIQRVGADEDERLRLAHAAQASALAADADVMTRQYRDLYAGLCRTR